MQKSSKLAVKSLTTSKQKATKSKKRPVSPTRDLRISKKSSIISDQTLFNEELQLSMAKTQSCEAHLKEQIQQNAELYVENALMRQSKKQLDKIRAIFGIDADQDAAQIVSEYVNMSDEKIRSVDACMPSLENIAKQLENMFNTYKL